MASVMPALAALTFRLTWFGLGGSP